MCGAQTSNPSTWKVKAGELQIQGQPGLQTKNPSKTKTQTTTTKKKQQ
jgi:hypothetical protein